MENIALSPQQEKLSRSRGSSFAIYKEYSVGKEASFYDFLKYELITFIGIGLPGIIGFGFRSLLYPSLFKNCRSGIAVGKGVTIRGGGKITIGKKVLIDDYAVIDARGEGAEIVIEDYVSIGRFTTVAAKDGKITIKAGVNIGSYCRVATQSKLSIGESTLVAAYSYLGPGNHKTEGTGPLIAQEMENRGGTMIGAQCWIGAHTTVMDGVTIGDKSVVGAHSFVNKDVQSNTTVIGAPAKPLSE